MGDLRQSVPASVRRRHLRRTFDARIDREWGRYAGEPRRVLVRHLRERFLRQHLSYGPGVVLELGPGPGRFSSTILGLSRGPLLAIDLSREVLRRGQRRLGGDPRRRRVSWIQGAGEHLPLQDRSVGTAVVLGNIVCFAGTDGPRLLREIARVVRPGGTLVADFASPAAATQEFFEVVSRRRQLRRILRRPEFYLIHQILDSGYQPYLPRRLAAWEFQFYTVDSARQALVRAGFRVRDAMAVGAVGWTVGRIAASARREPRTWENLLRIEERIGRRPGALETGHGFLVAATRAARRRREPRTLPTKP